MAHKFIPDIPSSVRVLRPGTTLFQALRRTPRKGGRGRGFTLPVQMSEGVDCFYIHILMPGVSREDVTLEIAGQCLSVWAERKNPPGTYLRKDRISGLLYREIDFDTSVDTGNVTAELKNGVLFVKVPKLPKCHSMRIEVCGEDDSC